MSKDLKKLFEGKDSRTIAIVIMDMCHKKFTEENFSFYKFSLEIFYHLSQLLKDNIITKEKFEDVNKDLDELVNTCFTNMNK